MLSNCGISLKRNRWYENLALLASIKKANCWGGFPLLSRDGLLWEYCLTHALNCLNVDTKEDGMDGVF